MTAARAVGLGDVVIPAGVDNSLQQEIVGILGGTPTIHIMPSAAATAALTDLLSPDKTENDIFNALKAMGPPANHLKHFYKMGGAYDFDYKGDATARTVAKKIYAAVQYAALLYRLKDYPEFVAWLKDLTTASLLKTHWLNHPFDLNRLGDFLNELSNLPPDSKNVHNEVEDRLRAFLGVPRLIYATTVITQYPANTIAPTLIKEARYVKNIESFPQLKSLAATTPALKAALIERWSQKSAPSPEQLQTLWKALSPPVPDEKTAKAAILKVFDNDQKIEAALKLSGSFIRSLSYDAAYQQILDASQYNLYLTLILNQHNVKTAIKTQLESGATDVNAIIGRMTAFNKTLSTLTIPADDKQLDAIKTAFTFLAGGIDLAAQFPSDLKLEMPAIPPILGPNGPALAANLKAHQLYANFMLDNAEVFKNFPQLRAAFENPNLRNVLIQNNLLDTQKLLDALPQRLLNLTLPPAVNAARHRVEIAKVLDPNTPVALVEAFKIAIPDGGEEDFKNALENYQFITKDLKDFPTLQAVFRAPAVQAVLKKRKQNFPVDFISQLQSELDDANTPEMLGLKINYAVDLDGDLQVDFLAALELQAVADTIRGELRFHQFMTAMNASGNPQLIQIFNHADIKKALLDYWKTYANWKWDQTTFQEMVDKMVDAIAKQPASMGNTVLVATIGNYLKNGAAIPKLAKALDDQLSVLNGTKRDFHKHVQLEAQFKQRLAALSQTNKALAEVINGRNVRVFLEKAWLQNGFPTEEEIRKLENTLSTSQPNETIIVNLLAHSFKIFPPALLMTEIKADNRLSDAASLTAFIMSSKYAVFLEQLDKAPGLKAIFAVPTIKILLEKYWETNPAPTSADFQEYFAQMALVGENEHAKARAAIKKLISKGTADAGLETALDTALDTAGLLSISSTVDTDLQPLRAEARYAVFNQQANALLSTPPLAKKVVTVLSRWRLATNKFPTQMQMLASLEKLSNLDAKVSARDLADHLNTEFFNKKPIVAETDISNPLQVIGAVRYDYYMLERQKLLNNPNNEIIKNILTHPAIRGALITHWQTEDFPTSKLSDLAERLKTAKTDREIHNVFNDFFNTVDGSPLSIALGNYIKANPLITTTLVDRASAESARRAILENIDQAELSDEFQAAGVTLTKAAVEALNKHLRERPAPPPALEAKDICDVITAKLTGPEKIAFDAKFPAGLNPAQVAEVIRAQPAINNIYQSFVSDGKNPGPNLTKVNDPSVTTLANQKLRNCFLKNGWELDAKNSDAVKKLLETNYHGLDYDIFIQHHLLPALLTNGLSLRDVKLQLTQKDFAVLQNAYFSSNLNAKFFEQSFFSLKQYHANVDQVHKIEELLEEVTNNTTLMDAPYSETLSAREKEDIDKKIAKIEKLQENLEELYKTRERIQAQLDIFEQTLLKYRKNIALDEKWGGIELSNGTLKNIFNLLVNDSDPAVSKPAKKILANIDKDEADHKNFKDSIEQVKQQHPETVKAFTKMEGIYYAWKHEPQIQKLIDQSKNKDEMDKLKISIDEAKKIHETYKKIKDNAALLPQERLVARYYSDVSTTTFDLDEGFRSSKIVAEVKKLQDKYKSSAASTTLSAGVEVKKLQDIYKSSAASTTLSAGVDMSMVADRVAGGDIMRANLENKKTLMYEHTLGMIGVLAVDTKEVSIDVRLDGGGKGGLVSGQEKPHTLLLFLAKKTEHHFLPDRGKKPDAKDPKKSIPGDIIKGSQLKKAMAFWRYFQSTRVDKLTPDNLDKEIQKYLAEKVAKDPNDTDLRRIVDKISPTGKDLSTQYIATSTKRVGASGWGERGALLPNVNFFRAALININTIAGTTTLAFSDQKLIRDEKTGQLKMKGRVSRGVPLKVDTKDYMLYVAIMCAARRKGYKVINLTQFPPIPEKQMAVYMRALSHPGEDNEHRKLFKLTEAQIRGEQSSLSQTEVIRREAKALDVKLIEDKKETPKWPRPK